MLNILNAGTACTQLHSQLDYFTRKILLKTSMTTAGVIKRNKNHGFTYSVVHSDGLIHRAATRTEILLYTWSPPEHRNREEQYRAGSAVSVQGADSNEFIQNCSWLKWFCTTESTSGWQHERKTLPAFTGSSARPHSRLVDSTAPCLCNTPFASFAATVSKCNETSKLLELLLYSNKLLMYMWP